MRFFQNAFSELKSVINPSSDNTIFGTVLLSPIEHVVFSKKSFSVREEGSVVYNEYVHKNVRYAAYLHLILNLNVAVNSPQHFLSIVLTQSLQFEEFHIDILGRYSIVLQYIIVWRGHARVPTHSQCSPIITPIDIAIICVLQVPIDHDTLSL